MATAKKAAGKKATAGKATGAKATKKASGAKRAAEAKVPAKKTAGTKGAARAGAAPRSAAGKAAAKKAPAKKNPVKKGTAAGKGRASLAKGKDPKGGLTAEGRRYFKEKEGLNLRPGVKGKADTPEKMVRKGSFLRRHFANPPGPVKGKKGEATRQALQAAAWGEPVPQNEADEKKLAAKGSELLEQYHAIQDGKKAAKPGKKTAPAKRPGKKG